MTTAITAYALQTATNPSGDDAETVAVFATKPEATDYYISRKDLRGYFWSIQPEEVAPEQELPCVFWTREKVAAGLAEQSVAVIESVVEQHRDVAWDDHVADMTETYGRLDPECRFCEQRVWMALQGVHAGGIFTTVEADQGPLSSGLNGPGVKCAASPDGTHHTDLTWSWR